MIINSISNLVFFFVLENRNKTWTKNWL